MIGETIKTRVNINNTSKPTYENKKRTFLEMKGTSRDLIWEASTRKLKLNSLISSKEVVKSPSDTKIKKILPSRSVNDFKAVKNSIINSNIFTTKSTIRHPNTNYDNSRFKNNSKSLKDDKIHKNTEFTLDEKIEEENKNDNKNKKKLQNILNFRLKSSEEIILEEMKRYKFSANPLNKNIFKSNSTNTLINQNKPKENQKAIPHYITKKREDIILKNFKSCQILKTKQKNINGFKAKPLPNFTPIEVKKSTKMLTVPLSPGLKTKSRSLKK